MSTIAGFPYFKAEFDKKQRPVETDLQSRLEKWAEQNDLTDLLVLSHGWNNDKKEARDLYEELIGNIRARVDAGSGGGLPGRKLGILGIFWPSKKFANKDLIPGGAASGDDTETEDLLKAQIRTLKGFFDADSADQDLDALLELADTLDTDPESRAEFFRKARGMIGPKDDLDEEDQEEIPEEFFGAEDDDDLEALFDELKKPDFPGTTTVATTANGAAGLSFGGFKAGALRLINFLTYYQMKKRARKTAIKAVEPLLRALMGSRDGLRVHLAGHSFGGLLVTSVAWGGDAQPAALPISSMTLMQAAFSHNGFSEDFGQGKPGRYHSVLTGQRVSGPLLITHTRNDKAVGLAYALASRFAGQNAAALGLGDADDPFGGIGANGAQHTPGDKTIKIRLEAEGDAYAFESGKVYNLLADDFIADHSDVRGREVAHAIAEAIATT